MELLTVATVLYGIHHDVFRCHEGKLAAKALLNYLRVYHKSVYDVQAKIQNSVDGKEALGNGKSLVCGIIQGSLKPLGCGGNGRIQCIHHYIS